MNTDLLKPSPAQRQRAILTQQEAIEIFSFREGCSELAHYFSARAVGTRYGVNERTVRDIWRRRTWAHATSVLIDTTSTTLGIRKAGRPRGSKDARPRKTKSFHHVETTQQNLLVGEIDSANIDIENEKIDRQNLAKNEIVTAGIQVQAYCSLEICAVSSVPAEQLEICKILPFESIDDVLYSWAQQGCVWISNDSVSNGSEYQKDRFNFIFE